MLPGLDAILCAVATPTFPEVIDSAVTNASVTSPYSVNLPSNIKKGQILVGTFYRGGNNTQTLTLPAGWTKLIDEGPNGAQTYRVVVAWKIADGTEGATMSVSSTLTSSQATRTVIVLVNGGVSVECSAKANIGNATTIDPPSISPSWGDAFNLFLTCCVGTSNSALSSYPSGWTGITSTGPSAYAYLQSKASSANPGVFTVSASMGLTAYTLTVKPEYI